MNRTRLRLVFALTLLGAAVGFSARTPTSVLSPATAQAAGAAVTPKTEAPNEARALSHAFSNVAKALAPSVVRIEVEIGGGRGMGPHGRMPVPNDEGDEGGDDEVPPFFRHFFGPGGGGMPAPGPAHGVGSGFIIDTNGDIVTNRHVVQGATKVTVTMNDEKEYSAHVVGKDAQTDVAVVRLDHPPSNLVVARLGDSDKLDVGEWVVAVGSPLGLEQTVTAGIVSGKGRPGRHVQMSGRRVRGYIQTDAKINPGNSGGPLVNLEGEVVGVNTLIQVGAGGAYGFAIPVNEVRRVAQALVKEGRVRYAYLGLMLTDVKDLDEAQKAKLGKSVPSTGAFVAETTPGGPAGKAGMRPGDVITEVNSQKIAGAGDVVDFVSNEPIGARVVLHYVRDGKQSQTQVALGELPDEDARQNAEQGQAKLGLALQTLTPDVAASLGIDRGTKGAVITDVVDGSPAEHAGLRPGDVIVEVDRRPVSSADDAVSALHGAARNGGHLLRVRGPNGTRFVTVK
ncbi:MAG TPA: trypsin-like peptidase domain-containing protein [Polyangia bacterium]|jgi:serine protease Do|nr:trypsin-like peptidase domain-containing protein [Polyangia bacterium]